MKIFNNTFIAPVPLAKGDKIIITAPAGRIEPAKINRARDVLIAEGYWVEIMPHAWGTWNMFSGTDDERLGDLQQAFDDKECSVIWMARGGYGLVRILDKLDMRGFLSRPKWVVGFSDITLLHARLVGFNVQSLHGPMVAAFGNFKESGASLALALLSGERPSFSVPPHKLNRQGSTSGVLIGGNLSILCSLMGSPDEPDTEGKILFIEDVGEYLYRLDRMLHTLKRANKLHCLAGLIVGGFTHMKDGEPGIGIEVEYLIRQMVEAYEYPVCFGFPTGHLDYNHPLILGARANLQVNEEYVSLSYL